MNQAAQIIAKLGMQPLVEEGGFFVRTYEVPDPKSARPLTTAILFLISAREFSALHRLGTDEIYHFYAGDPTELVQISATGQVTKTILGPDVLGGQSPQVVVPGGVWQGTRLVAGGQWALLGATMTPGFDPADFELASRSGLSKKFPGHQTLIKRFTRAR